jgi:hypothetical protein
MDDLTSKQLTHVRELCRRATATPPPGNDPMQNIAFVGLTIFGFMLDAELAERAEREAAKGKKK